MTSSNFTEVVNYLNGNLSSRLQNIPSDINAKIQEITLRVNSPVCITLSQGSFFLTVNGCVTNSYIKDNMLIATKKDILEAFNNMCNYSVYARQNEIKNGFIILKGGHRAGICGTAVCDDKGIVNIRDISSVNIRVASEHKGCSHELFNRIGDVKGGLLICGAPCSGKTTFIRDLAKVLSFEKLKKVSVIDSRGEIAATYRGVPQKDIGNCDVLNGYSKTEGFSHALRCMAPEFIICDEIGSQEDIRSIENSVNSGVSVIATVHCSSKKELSQKQNIRTLLQLNAFQYIVFLSDRKNPGKITQVVKSADVLS